MISKLILTLGLGLLLTKASAQEQFKSVTELPDGTFQTEIIFTGIESKAEVEMVVNSLQAKEGVISAEFFNLNSGRTKLISGRIFFPQEIRNLIGSADIELDEKCITNN